MSAGVFRIATNFVKASLMYLQATRRTAPTMIKSANNSAYSSGIVQPTSVAKIGRVVIAIHRRVSPTINVSAFRPPVASFSRLKGSRLILMLYHRENTTFARKAHRKIAIA